MPVIKTDRESIIRKSIHLFKVHGYYSTTMANIGEACGLIKGSIYHHFKSKEELALACLQYIHDFFAREIFAIAGRPSLSAKEKLKRFTLAVEDYFMHSEGGCLLGNFALEISNNIPLLKDEIVSYFDAWEQAVYEILKPELGEQAAREKAVQIVAGTQGNIMLMRLHGKPDAFQAHNRDVMRLLD